MKVTEALQVTEQANLERIATLDQDSKSVHSLDKPSGSPESGSVQEGAATAEQDGVARADAITRTWTKSSLRTVYIL